MAAKKSEIEKKSRQTIYSGQIGIKFRKDRGLWEPLHAAAEEKGVSPAAFILDVLEEHLKFWGFMENKKK